ncbi:MAG: carbohydrate-binding protein [Vicinamibacterales bacterium]
MRPVRFPLLSAAALVLGALMIVPLSASAATYTVCSSGCTYTDLQRALDDAQPGDTILLTAGETYVGHFVLPAKDQWGSDIVIRTASAGAALPGPGVRLVPDGYPASNVHRSSLARLVGRGGQWKTTPVIAAAPGAHGFRIELIDIDGIEQLGWYTLVEIGTNNATQTTLQSVPSNIVLDRVFVHGHPAKGQQRCVGLNGASVEVRNSFIASCASFAVDSQAIGTFNGPGPIKIINNYVEASTENIMFGGSDPLIPGLVPSDIEIKRNHFSKPLSYRSPILAAPDGAPSASLQTGGALSDGTYYFRVVAVMDSGSDLAFSAPSPERPVATSSGNAVRLDWSPVEGADKYRIYAGTAPGAQNRFLETQDGTTSLVYSGWGETWQIPPTRGTLWNVKNLLELKNAQRVSIDGNVFEHIWPSAQTGYAILLTPRNDQGTAPWTVVQDVTISNNIIRHASGVLNILGSDDIYPTQETARISIRNNLAYDISSTWGGASHFAVITRSPSDVTLDHNSVFMEGMLVLADDGTSGNFRFTNNLSPHNEYGFYGSGVGTGSAGLNAYFPDAVFRRNGFGGGYASSYPADNVFTDVNTFRSQFVSIDGGDFRLAGDLFRGKATDGRDIGVDFAELGAATAGVVTGEADLPIAPVPGGTGSGGNGSGSTGGGAGSGGASSPVGGSVALPGLIQAEDFDNGGIGVAYGDSTSGNAGGEYRMSDVDVEGSGDSGGGYNIGWMTPGEWLNYSVSVTSAGTYDLEFRVAAPSGGGTFHLEVNGVDRTGPITIPNTGGWQDWATIARKAVSLAAGPQSWRLVIDTAASGVVGNLNYIRVVAAGGGATIPAGTAASGGVPATLPGVVQAERFDDGGYFDRSPGNAGGAYRSSDVDVEDTADSGGGYNVGWVEPGEWLQYTVSVVTAGSYDLEFRIASPDAGGSFHLEINGTNVTGPVSVPATGDWQAWTTIRKQGVALSAGIQVWRLVFDGTGSGGGIANFNFLRAAAGTSSAAVVDPPVTTGAGDIVLYAEDVNRIAGNWTRQGSSSGAGGQKMHSADLGISNTDRPFADPSDFFEAQFVPEANRAYRVWVRLRAVNDSKYNDSVWVQFSAAVNGSGSPLWRIATTEGLLVNLEPCANCGVSLWGWAGGGWWTGETATVRFTSASTQTLRVQIREDGAEIDQIVLSPVTYFDRVPGATSGDVTIVPKR